MATVAAPNGDIITRAKSSLMEDLRLRTNLLSNPEWQRQMLASHEFFTSGHRGRSLADLGLE
jgi:hypothetical protein